MAIAGKYSHRDIKSPGRKIPIGLEKTIRLFYLPEGRLNEGVKDGKRLDPDIKMSN